MSFQPFDPYEDGRFGSAQRSDRSRQHSTLLSGMYGQASALRGKYGSDTPIQQRQSQQWGSQIKMAGDALAGAIGSIGGLLSRPQQQQQPANSWYSGPSIVPTPPSFSPDYSSAFSNDNLKFIPSAWQ
jgi:hypothetical protein